MKRLTETKKKEEPNKRDGKTEGTKNQDKMN